MKLFFVMLLAACGGQYTWHKPTYAEVAPQATAQRIAKREQYDARALPKGWRRSGDPVAGPVYILVSDQGYGCLVSAEDFTMAKDNEEWLCEWRRFRYMMER